jgi:hypothetical protein
MKAKTATAAMTRMSCRGVKAILAFCALEARSE